MILLRLIVALTVAVTQDQPAEPLPVRGADLAEIVVDSDRSLSGRLDALKGLVAATVEDRDVALRSLVGSAEEAFAVQAAVILLRERDDEVLSSLVGAFDGWSEYGRSTVLTEVLLSGRAEQCRDLADQAIRRSLSEPLPWDRVESIGQFTSVDLAAAILVRSGSVAVSRDLLVHAVAVHPRSYGLWIAIGYCGGMSADVEAMARSAAFAESDDYLARAAARMALWRAGNEDAGVAFHTLLQELLDLHDRPLTEVRLDGAAASAYRKAVMVASMLKHAPVSDVREFSGRLRRSSNSSLAKIGWLLVIHRDPMEALTHLEQQSVDVGIRRQVAPLIAFLEPALTSRVSALVGLTVLEERLAAFTSGGVASGFGMDGAAFVCM